MTFSITSSRSNRRGASLTSYGLVVGLVAIVALGAITSIGSSVDANFTNVSGAIDDAVTGEFAALASPSASAVNSPIFSFTSHTFTTCGATLTAGPSESACESAYSAQPWATNNSFFTVSAGVQNFTVPVSGTYRITVAGAQGGTPAGASSPRRPGYGRVMVSEFNLTGGDTLSIVVGQRGRVNTGGNTANGGGGGGGGSFVFHPGDSLPLIVGGGGGGLSIYNVSSPNIVANTDGRDGNTGEDGLPARNENAIQGTGGASATTGGRGWNDMRTSNFNGLNGFGFGQLGGFGGGGGAEDGSYHAGGGGGGYSGGGGGRYSHNTGFGNADGRNGGGGGGSYVHSSGSLISDSGTNSADGYVTLELQ